MEKSCETCKYGTNNTNGLSCCICVGFDMWEPKEDNKMNIVVKRKEVNRKELLTDILDDLCMHKTLYDDAVKMIDRIYTNPEPGEIDHIEISVNTCGVYGLNDARQVYPIMGTICISKEVYEQIKKEVEG